MTEFYLDVSQYDVDRHGGPLDWVGITALGMPAVCVRATYGDPGVYAPTTRHFRALSAAAERAGVAIRGGYHNLIHGDAASIARQVAFFRGELAAAGSTWAMLDVEPYEALRAKGLVPRWADVLAFAAEWRRVTSMTLAFYIARWVWDGYLGRPDLTVLGGPLVAARYIMGSTPGPARDLYSASGGDGGAGWEPYGGVVPAIWQFTSSAQVLGASNVSDVNAFRGTAAQLAALLIGDGGTMRSANMQVLTDQTRARYPGVVVYGIGDAAHKRSASGHNEDDTPGSLAEDQDADSKPEHRAIDVMIGGVFNHAAAAAYALALVSVAANQRRLLYVIFDRHIWRARNGWKQEAYTGTDPHTNHVHVSGEADDDENTTSWVLDIQQQQGDKMLTIFYDGTGYGIGDGISRRTILTWPEMLATQAAARAGTLGPCYKAGEIVTTDNARVYGVAVDETPDVDADSVDKLTETIGQLAARLAADDGNGLPADPAAIAEAVRESVGELAGRVAEALKSKPA